MSGLAGTRTVLVGQPPSSRSHIIRKNFGMKQTSCSPIHLTGQADLDYRRAVRWGRFRGTRDQAWKYQAIWND